MPRFSDAFGINKSQAELDFVDVSLNQDQQLFVDPFAISQRPDRWSLECHRTLQTFFQHIIDSIKGNREEEARELLSHLREPNETRLGYSERRPKGAGIGTFQADRLFEALQGSAAVQTGFLSSLEECELMIDGIARDKISDLTTNIIRKHLVHYTQDQCQLFGIPLNNVPLPPCFDAARMTWVSEYVDLPLWRNRPILLVPKAIVRMHLAYRPVQYYREDILEFLQEEHLAAGSGLVRSLKNGRRVVLKKDLEAEHPFTKDFLYRFSREHPEILRGYKRKLERVEKQDIRSPVDEEDEPALAVVLSRALRLIRPGDLQAGEYHRLMIGVLEFIFFPKLLHPVKEREIHEGRKRIDIMMENGAQEGIFFEIAAVRNLPCAYVPFECKNYSSDVGNPELDQLSGRFATNRGKLGFLCCRRFQDREQFVRRCRDTFTDQRGLVIPLDDTTILRLLSHIERRERREIERDLRDFIGEVWVGS